MASQTSTKKYLAIGGMVAVIGVVGMIALDYPPAGDDAAGTIVPAKRFRADGGGTTIIGDSAATQTGTNIANGANAGQNAGANNLNAGANNGANNAGLNQGANNGANNLNAGANNGANNAGLNAGANNGANNAA